MTIVSGIRSGLQSGIRSGLNPSADPLASVSRDATSGIYCPATAGEWATLLAVAGLSISPLEVWLMQEASGNLAGSIAGLTLTANASPTYQNAITGWSRKAVGTADGTAAQRFSSTNAALPDLLTTSGLLLSYVQIASTPASVRGVMGIGTTQGEMRVTATPTARCISGINTGNGASNVGTAVRPWVNCFNQTADDNTTYTDQDKILTTFGLTVTGKQVQIGATAGAAAGPNRYLYAAMFSGANAELSSTQIKTLLQTLGWSPGWTP